MITDEEKKMYQDIVDSCADGFCELKTFGNEAEFCFNYCKKRKTCSLMANCSNLEK
jgi:hypothetical protein